MRAKTFHQTYCKIGLLCFFFNLDILSDRKNKLEIKLELVLLVGTIPPWYHLHIYAKGWLSKINKSRQAGGCGSKDDRVDKLAEKPDKLPHCLPVIFPIFSHTSQPAKNWHHKYQKYITFGLCVLCSRTIIGSILFSCPELLNRWPCPLGTTNNQRVHNTTEWP